MEADRLAAATWC